MHIRNLAPVDLHPDIQNPAPPENGAPSLPTQLVILMAEFNEAITGRLANGAALAARECGITDVRVWRVPGALEIPVLLHALADTHKWKGVSSPLIVTAGCVIRGDTDHYLHVCTQSIAGVQRIATDLYLPLGNAILTVENELQAIERCQDGPTNKGYEAAQAAWQIACLLNQIPSGR